MINRILGVALAALATMAAASGTATASTVPCSKLSAGKYQCTFYPAGDGITAGAPVQDATGKRVGYLNHGHDWIVCQASGATVHSGSSYNRWWGYTEANDHHFGWVNAVWASGGSNDGPFAAKVPNCGSTYGSPPTAASPPPAPTPTPKQVPCHAAGGGHYDCTFYPAGDGIHGGAPVLRGSARVGYLNQGTDWIVCQQRGAEYKHGSAQNDWWGWTEANDKKTGWVSAVWARGGDNDQGFSGVPSCGGAHGTPPAVGAKKPVAPPPPKDEHNDNTVALGDSYSSGLGNPSYYQKAPCWRSYGAYAWQMVYDLNLNITDFEACAGATTSSLLHDQIEGHHIGGLSTSTGVVTLSIGGNDADFVGVLGRCLVAKSWCDNQLRKERKVIRTQLPGRLNTVYQAIKKRAPHAKVVVLGYPYIFGSCAKGGGVSELHGATDLLDNTIKAATVRNHVYFVDPRMAFTGHSECDKDAWINHFYGGEPQVSFHPDEAGWSEDAQLIEGLLWKVGW
jgi:hypothetical protein